MNSANKKLLNNAFLAQALICLHIWLFYIVVTFIEVMSCAVILSEEE